MILYIAIVVYTPALALETVMGLDVDISCASIFIICVFYTSIGGMKAVIWTDVFQLFFMVLSILIIVILATMNAGGASQVEHIKYFMIHHIFNKISNAFRFGMTTIKTAEYRFSTSTPTPERDTHSGEWCLDTPGFISASLESAKPRFKGNLNYY